MMVWPVFPEEAVAITSVWWDMDRCGIPPVPPWVPFQSFDPHQMAPSIKRALNRLGYSGPLTITAIGKLCVPDDFLRALSSSGIALNIVPRDSVSIMAAMCLWARENPPPSNLMLVTDSESYCPTLTRISSMGHNVIRMYPAMHICMSVLNEAIWLRNRRRLKKCYEPGESALFCSVCNLNFTGQGFEAFTKHRWSEEHALSVLVYRKNPTTMVEEATKEKVPEEEGGNKTKKITYSSIRCY